MWKEGWNLQLIRCFGYLASYFVEDVFTRQQKHAPGAFMIVAPTHVDHVAGQTRGWIFHAYCSSPSGRVENLFRIFQVQKSYYRVRLDPDANE